MILVITSTILVICVCIALCMFYDVRVIIANNNSYYHLLRSIPPCPLNMNYNHLKHRMPLKTCVNRGVGCIYSSLELGFH